MVKKIGCDAFKDCNNLTKIEIPESVTEIEEDAFYGCSNLEEIHMKNKNLNEMSIDSDSFLGIYHSTLFVPIGTEEEYKKHPAFGRFNVIGE